MVDEKSPVKTSFRIFHGIICIILLCGGCAIFGYSLYLQITGKALVPDLNYTNSNSTLNLVTNSAIAGIIIGAVLAVFAIIGFITFNRGCCGVVFGIIYSIAMLAVVGVLIAVAVISLQLDSNSESETTINSAKTVWMNSVTDPSFSQQVCQVKLDYNCKGFETGDCTGCPATGDRSSCTSSQLQVCAACNYELPDDVKGCYPAIVDTYEGYYKPVGITSAVLAGFAFIDVIIIWIF